MLLHGKKKKTLFILRSVARAVKQSALLGSETVVGQRRLLGGPSIYIQTQWNSTMFKVFSTGKQDTSAIPTTYGMFREKYSRRKFPLPQNHRLAIKTFSLNCPTCHVVFFFLAACGTWVSGAIFRSSLRGGGGDRHSLMS